MTIIHRQTTDFSSSGTLALQALAWLLADERRAQRFLDLTGLTPDELRDGLGEPGTQRAIFDFLLGHEPDLVAAAEALGIAPEEFAQAARGLPE